MAGSASATRTLATELTLLESKLRPPPQRSGLIQRRGVVHRLSAGRRKRVAVVEAPAGYGKTTALAEWARSDRRRFGWFTADEFDDDPVDFLAYVAAALSATGADVDRAVARLADEGASSDAIAAELGAAFAALEEPAVLVLDDLHNLTDPDCLDALAVLVEHVPAHSQIILAARTQVDFPPAVRAAGGYRVALGWNDLRLSDAEAGALLRANGIESSETDVRSLNARCDGWATGLYLAGIAVRDSGRLDDDARLGAERHIVDYFRLEVLDRLTADDRELLRDVSVVHRICGSLCDAMAGRSESALRLASLAQANVFLVPLDGGEGWFALHPLFRETLEGELERRRGGVRKALLVRAGDWFEARGDTETAIECAIAAEDGNRVAALCAHALLPAYWSGRLLTVERWCAAVDDVRLLARHPAVATLGAAFHALAGRPETAERWARILFQTDKNTVMPDGSRADAWMANLRALLCARGVETMREDAEYAVRTLASGSSVVPGAHVLLGFACHLGGDDERATGSFVAAVDRATGLGANVGASIALAALSVLATTRGEAQEADDYAQRAHGVVDSAGLDEYVTSAYVHAASARSALLRGRRSAAKRDLDCADRLVGRMTWVLPWLAAPTRLELAELHLEFANPARARVLLDEIDEILVQRPSLGVVGERAARLRQDLDAGRSTSGDWASVLTAAELRLLPLLAGHLSFREIAQRLSISRNTVKTQAIAVYRKLGVSSRSQAVARARELGILSLEVAPRPARRGADHPNGTMR